MPHSPEPWKINDDGTIVGSDGSEVCDSVVGCRYHDDPAAMSEDDKDRIVACVNFCHGIQTDMLKEALKAWSPTKGPLSDARQAYWRLRYALRGDE